MLRLGDARILDSGFDLLKLHTDINPTAATEDVESLENTYIAVAFYDDGADDGGAMYGLTVEGVQHFNMLDDDAEPEFFADGSEMDGATLKKQAMKYPDGQLWLWGIIQDPVEKEVTLTCGGIEVDILSAKPATESDYNKLLLALGQSGRPVTMEMLRSLIDKPGQTGAKGEKGDKGENGASIYTASAVLGAGATATIASVNVPSGKVLSVGDLVIDTAGNMFSVASRGGEHFTPSDRIMNIKGAKGEAGAAGAKGEPGAAGAAGAKGASVKSISLTKNADGAITGGTATLTDNSTVAITVTEQA